MVHSNDPRERVEAFRRTHFILEHLLYNYIGDAIAPNTEADATLNSGVKEAIGLCVEPNIKYCDALDYWKGEGSEKKQQKCGKEEENGEEAEHPD